MESTGALSTDDNGKKEVQHLMRRRPRNPEMHHDGDPKAPHKSHERDERPPRRVRAHPMAEKPQKSSTRAAHYHICKATKRRCCFSSAQGTTWLLAAQFFLVLPKRRHCWKQDPGLDRPPNHSSMAACPNTDTMFQAWLNYSDATLKNPFSSISHSNGGMKYKNFPHLPNTQAPP